MLFVKCLLLFSKLQLDCNDNIYCYFLFVPSYTSFCIFSTFIFFHLCSSFYSSAGGIASSMLLNTTPFPTCVYYRLIGNIPGLFNFYVTFPRSYRMKWKQIVNQFSLRRYDKIRRLTRRK